MNGDKYKQLIDQLKQERTLDGKLDILGVIVCMVATNDMDHIYKRLKRLEVIMLGMLVILFLAFPNIVKTVIEFIGRVL